MKNTRPQWLPWLRACARDPQTRAVLPTPLGALTGQDKRALAAIAACWELYMSSDDDGARGALAAIRALLPAVQPHCRCFARELIAWAGDWGHRDKLWPLVQPDDFTPTHEITNAVRLRETLEQDIREARERVARLESDEADADARCRRSTALNDPNLPQYRELSVSLGHKLEQARADLQDAERALRDSSTDAEAELHDKRLAGLE